MPPFSRFSVSFLSGYSRCFYINVTLTLLQNCTLFNAWFWQDTDFDSATLACSDETCMYTLPDILSIRTLFLLVCISSSIEVCIFSFIATFYIFMVRFYLYLLTSVISFWSSKGWRYPCYSGPTCLWYPCYYLVTRPCAWLNEPGNGRGVAMSDVGVEPLQIITALVLTFL